MSEQDDDRFKRILEELNASLRNNNTTSDSTPIEDYISKEIVDWVNLYATHVDRLASSTEAFNPIASNIYPSFIYGLHDINTLVAFAEGYIEICDTEKDEVDRVAGLIDYAVQLSQLSFDSKDFFLGNIVATAPFTTNIGLLALAMRETSVLKHLLSKRGEASFPGHEKFFELLEKGAQKAEAYDADNPEEKEIWVKLVSGNYTTALEHFNDMFDAMFSFSHHITQNGLKKMFGLEIEDKHIPEEVLAHDSFSTNAIFLMRNAARAYTLWRQNSYYVCVPLILQIVAKQANVAMPKAKKATKTIKAIMEDVDELYI